MVRPIDADAFDKCLEDAEKEAIFMKKYVFASALNTIRGNLRIFPTIEPEPKWIPVSERLPDKPYGCLVTVMDTEPMTMEEFPNILPYFVGYDGEQWNDSDGMECPFEIIAWLPLPKPYREEGD